MFQRCRYHPANLRNFSEYSTQLLKNLFNYHKNDTDGNRLQISPIFVNFAALWQKMKNLI